MRLDNTANGMRYLMKEREKNICHQKNDTTNFSATLHGVVYKRIDKTQTFSLTWLYTKKGKSAVEVFDLHINQQLTNKNKISIMWSDITPAS